MRKLSQTGLIRIPHNPRQRVALEGGRKPAGEVLEALNDKQEGRWLHPTKGWREMSAERTNAALVVAQIMFRERTPRSLTAGRSKYMPHIGAKQRAKGAARAA